MNTAHTNTQANRARSHGSSGIPVKGKFVLVDKADIAAVAGRAWFLKSGYAVTTGGMLMHSLIVHPPDGMFVDHANGDPLDNRRANLRVCTHAQNSRNRKKHSSHDNPYKGITRSKTGWCAQIEYNGWHIHLGVFGDAKAAALIYDAAARRIFGNFARCNFSEEKASYTDIAAVVRLKLQLIQKHQSQNPSLAA